MEAAINGGWGEGMGCFAREVGTSKLLAAHGVLDGLEFHAVFGESAPGETSTC
jgi:hypothetical protein